RDGRWGHPCAGAAAPRWGGVVSRNRPFDVAVAVAVDEIFTEVLLAPGFDDEALARLRKKKSRRLLRYRPERIDRAELDWKRVYGGLLLQQPDASDEDVAAARVVTQRKPSEPEVRALGCAWKVAKHAKSNAVVFATGNRTLAIGAGQTSRVDAVWVARRKAERMGVELTGSVLASDAFFPFPDGLEAAVAAGAPPPGPPGGPARGGRARAAGARP